jgi:hypothetical protein
MYFIRDEIVDSLMEQQKIFYIKYYSFHDVIEVVKSTIFKLKIININIYFLKLFYNFNLKTLLTKHIKLFFIQF